MMHCCLISFLLFLLQLILAACGFLDFNGRLAQVEYAYQATLKSGTILTSKTNQSILIITMTPKLFDYQSDTQRILPLNSQTYICGTGISADVRYLTNKMFESSVDHSVTFGSEMPIQRIAEDLASMIHENTLYESARPYGASILLFGQGNTKESLKIIEIDPLGNMHDCIVTCIGCFSKEIISGLSEENNPTQLEEEEAIRFLLKGIQEGLKETEKQIEDYTIQLFKYEPNKKLQSISLESYLK